MPLKEIDFGPVSHLTTDAIGKPGERVFYVQATWEEKVITLLVEKPQIQMMSVGVEQFLTEITQRLPDLPEATNEYDEEKMHILPPVDPLFRVGEMGLTYDTANDQVALVAKELSSEGEEDKETTMLRIWCTRSQLRQMARWGLEIANRGRPICPQCGEPIEPGGHLCPKKNGHKH